MIILNDGSPTFLSSSGSSHSVIDLSIASRDLAILAEVITTQDLCDSDHFPVNIVVRNTKPSSCRFFFLYA